MKRKHSAQIIKQTHTTTHKHARTSKQTSKLTHDQVNKQTTNKQTQTNEKYAIHHSRTRANTHTNIQTDRHTNTYVLVRVLNSCQVKYGSNTHAQANKTSNLTHNQTNTQQINMHKQMQSINPAPVQTHTKNQTNTRSNTQTSRHTCSSESSGLMSCAVHVTLGIFGSTSHTRSRRTKKPSHHSSHA